MRDTFIRLKLIVGESEFMLLKMHTFATSKLFDRQDIREHLISD